MLAYYKSWPDQASAFLATASPPDVGRFDRLVITGWGASLIPSLFVYDALMPDVPEGLEIMKGIEPPKPKERALFLAVSMGGNTLEVSYSLKKALELGYKAIAIAGGGLLERAATKWGVPMMKIPQAPASRLGFPIITLAVASVIDGVMGLNSVEGIASAFKLLERELDNKYEEAKDLAVWMNEAQYLVVYHSSNQETISRRMKYLLSENAKLRSFHENILDVIHDGIGCWEFEYGSRLILLRDSLDHEIVSERFDIVKEVVSSLNFKVRDFTRFREPRPFFLLDRLYVLDLATVYLGLLRRSDPSVVRTQKIARERMARSSYYKKMLEQVS
jgi:bifunctional phosphoglucose/phosphomannose isomerase